MRIKGAGYEPPGQVFGDRDTVPCDRYERLTVERHHARHAQKPDYGGPLGQNRRENIRPQGNSVDVVEEQSWLSCAQSKTDSIPSSKATGGLGFRSAKWTRPLS